MFNFMLLGVGFMISLGAIIVFCVGVAVMVGGLDGFMGG